MDFNDYWYWGNYLDKKKVDRINKGVEEVRVERGDLDYFKKLNR